MDFIYFLIYLLIINIVTAFLFLIDKIKAKTNAFRTREKTLIMFCLFGGALGGLFSMVVFNHKIRKPKFLISIPLLVIIYIII
ncbi:MAG: DUF1294 domain-containing protein, partial [Clostridia bacterium]|nr:DUF1294 domain-containing protein [Clostridia bacterium]